MRKRAAASGIAIAAAKRVLRQLQALHLLALLARDVCDGCLMLPRLEQQRSFDVLN